MHFLHLQSPRGFFELHQQVVGAAETTETTETTATAKLIIPDLKAPTAAPTQAAPRPLRERPFSGAVINEICHWLHLYFPCC